MHPDPHRRGSKRSLNSVPVHNKNTALLQTRGFGVQISGSGRGPKFCLGPVDLTLMPRCKIGLVGVSGCGKSTLAKALLGVAPGRSFGSLHWRDSMLLDSDLGTSKHSCSSWARYRREVQILWQDARAALDPQAQVKEMIAESRALAGLAQWSRGQIEHQLANLNLRAEVMHLRPRALSGGECQRVALARALAAEPSLLIADEITSALDRGMAWKIIDLLRETTHRQMGVLMISHDLALLRGWVDEVLVLDRGKIVERGPWQRLYDQPHHPATRALVEAIPRLPDSPAAGGPALKQPKT